MMRKVIAILIMAGASYAFPYDNESKLEASIPEDVPNGGLISENVPLPEDAPLAPDNGVPLSESLPATFENGPVPDGMSDEDLTSKGVKPEGTDLKTDATFWWPYYRSYYRYPHYYRHYRPRFYHRYYYW